MSAVVVRAERALGAEVERLLERGEPELALSRVERFLETRQEPHAYVEQARVLLRLKRLEEAHDALAQALRLDPRNTAAEFVLGTLHKQERALDLAAASYERVLKEEPSHTEARYELGWVYQEQGRLREALVLLQQAHAERPDDLRIANQLAYVLVRLERFDRGIALFERICARTSPAVVRPRINLSNALLRIGRFERALEVLEQILAVEPNNVEARWNRSHLLLGSGRYVEGWRDYDYRRLLKSRPARLLPFAPWDGEPLEGKRIFVAAEQGLGDEIMFASCIPDLLSRAGEVHLECERRLAPLFARSFPAARVWPSDHESAPLWLSELPPVDCFARAGSLPRYLRNGVEDFPPHPGYLKAAGRRVEHWRAQLGALGTGLKIGLSWRGGTQSTRSSMRSLPLAQLEALLCLPGCRWVSLQYGEVRAELDALRAAKDVSIVHWQAAIDDYDETAALVSALDLVVSVQTSAIHLAGALGQAALVLVPAAPEWRYGTSGERMPWYPSVRLYRQVVPGDWSHPLRRLIANVRERTGLPQR